MSCVFTPSRCHINLGALVRNFARLGKAETLTPVIKSDAYGHGLLPVAKALDAAGARSFAVGCASEGEALRDSGLVQQDILLLLGCLSAEDWAIARKRELVPLAGKFEDLDRAAAQDGPMRIAIKCDTGMSRLGFSMAEIGQLAEKLRGSPNIEPYFLVSHLACADMPAEDEFTSAQIERYNEFYGALKSFFPNLRRSLANSAGTMALPEYRYESARAGLALYGGDPFYDTSRAGMIGDLEWVMSVSAPILHIRELAAGQSVSYGRIFTAPAPMRIAIVASGYATGVNRALSNKMYALAQGRRVRQRGRICMGMLMLDISGLENVKAGDEVWLLGGDALPGEKSVDAQEIANALGTIPYEIMCLMGSLNPRAYYRAPSSRSCPP